MTCDGFDELVAGRALDALEPREDAVLDAHLAGCADCRVLLDTLRATAADLAHGVDDHEPPPELLDRIRGAIAVDRPVAEVLPLVSRRRRVPGPARSLPALAAGLAVLVAIGAAGWLVQTRSDEQQARHALAQSQEVLTRLQDQGAYAVALTPDGAATGTAVVDGDEVDLITRNLGRNDVGSTQYVLWAAGASDGARMTAVTHFDVTSAGASVVHARLPAGMTAPRLFGVTYEKGRELPATPGGRAVLGSGPAG